MLEKFDKIIYDIGELNENDGDDEELDYLMNEVFDILLNMSIKEKQEVLKRPYIGIYKNIIKEFLIEHNAWEEEYYGN